MSDTMLPLEAITRKIHVLRGQKVLLDADLASLYGVSTKRFNEQVKRNLARFPADFMFQLNEDEFAALRSQFATSNGQVAGRGEQARVRSGMWTRTQPLCCSSAFLVASIAATARLTVLTDTPKYTAIWRIENIVD
ncbi:ORF6N domain-containing protein [Oxalobacteraceae bacterium]|nr:ORF6N domain-containing protein [Oxalobacteraceae bacterium]